MVNNSTEKEIMSSLMDRESRRVNRVEYLLEQEAQKTSPELPMNYPDAKKHQLVSFVKSAIRIVGYIFIPINLVISAGFLILAEIVGVIEELV